jgi:hypothetical protein
MSEEVINLSRLLNCEPNWLSINLRLSELIYSKEWLTRYSELLGCDDTVADVEISIKELLRQDEIQRRTIGKLRGSGSHD